MLPHNNPLVAIVGDLGSIAHAPDSTVRAVDGALTRFLPFELDRLRAALGAAPADIASVPQDIARDWLLQDGQARVEVLPVAEARNSQGLHRFIAEVTHLAPDAGGTAVTVVSTSDTIVSAFRSAAVAALLAIAVILVVALRRLRDAITELPGEIRRKLWALMVIGRGDYAAGEWESALARTETTADAEVIAGLMAEPYLHDRLAKALYEMAPGKPTPAG